MLQYPALQLWVRVLLSPPARAGADEAAGAPAGAPGASAPWECWNRLRVLCEAHVAAGWLVQRACRSSLGPQLTASASWGELYRLLVAPPTQEPTQGGQLSR